MAHRSTDDSNRIGRRTPARPPKAPRGIFGGNRSVKFGLIAILACILFLQIYNRSAGTVLSGPIDDVFRRNPEKLLIVYGTGGDNPAALRDYTHKVANLLGNSLGHEILVYPDTEVDRSLAEDYSLLLYGTLDGNRIANRLRDSFPFSISADTLRSGPNTYTGDDWQLVFAVTNPRNRQRYLLVYTGPADSSVIGINLLGNPRFVHHDTTDYVLSDSGRIVESGYFDKTDPEMWKLPGEKQ